MRADEQQILARDLAVGVEALEAGVQVRDDVGADVRAELLIGGSVGRHLEHDPLRRLVGHSFQTLLERLSERDNRRVRFHHAKPLLGGDCTQHTTEARELRSLIRCAGASAQRVLVHKHNAEMNDERELDN